MLLSILWLSLDFVCRSGVEVSEKSANLNQQMKKRDKGETSILRVLEMHSKYSQRVLTKPVKSERLGDEPCRRACPAQFARGSRLRRSVARALPSQFLKKCVNF